jgi:hypothetical protein
MIKIVRLDSCATKAAEASVNKQHPRIHMLGS